MYNAISVSLDGCCSEDFDRTWVQRKIQFTQDMRANLSSSSLSIRGEKYHSKYNKNIGDITNLRP